MYSGRAADHGQAGRRRRRLRPARHRRRLLRVAVLRRRLDAGRAPAALRDRRAVRRVGDLLVRVRAGRLDAEPVRRSQHADVGASAGRFRAATTSRCSRCSSSPSRRCSPGCGCGSADASRRARRSSAWGCCLSAAGFALLVVAAQLSANGVKVSPWWLVVTYLLHTWGELSLSPVGLSATIEAGADARRRPDDGRVLPGDLGRQLHRRPAVVALRIDAAAAACSARSPRSASRAGLVLFALTPPIKRLMGDVNCSWIWQSDDGSRRIQTEARFQEDAGTRRHGRGRSAPSGSSASRSIWPATCTTTSASSTTACCCRGRCPRDRRSIRRRSGSRCTSRIIRSRTASSKASSPKATAPASSCSGTTAPGRRSRTMWMRR